MKNVISRHNKINHSTACVSFVLKNVVLLLPYLKNIHLRVQQLLFEISCSLSTDDVRRLSDTASQRFCSICLTNLAQLYSLLLPVIWQFVLPLLAQPAVCQASPLHTCRGWYGVLQHPHQSVFFLWSYEAVAGCLTHKSTIIPPTTNVCFNNCICRPPVLFACSSACMMSFLFNFVLYRER
jgi:hypothetical protein